MCKYEDCSKKEEENKGGYCIFHCDKEKFKVINFGYEFEEYFKKQEDENVKLFNFAGFKFPKDFSTSLFIKKEFKKPVDFRGAKFSCWVDFRGAKFTDWVNFAGTEFDDGVKFAGTEFSSEVNFEEVRFKNKNAWANFWRVKFSGVVHFRGASFSNMVNFTRATFSNVVEFTGATFSSEASFKVVTFISDVIFYGVKFSNFNSEASFWNAMFKCRADFTGAIFSGKADFGRATFHDSVKFFGERYLFSWNDALKKDSIVIDFLRNELKIDWVEHAKVNRVGGSKTITVTNNENMLRFTLNEKDDKAILEVNGREINEYLLKKENGKQNIYDKNKVFQSSAIFLFSVFERIERVEFVKVDLSEASFLHCIGIEKVRFIDVDWASKVETKRKVIYDEIAINKGEHRDYELVSEVYRKLRMSYERSLRFAEAGDFYIGEMEMRKRNAELKKDKVDYYLVKLYKCFSYYGEDVRRPFYWMLGITFIFTFYYIQFNSLNLLDFEFGDIYRFLGYFGTSTMVFFQMPPDNLTQTFLMFIERLLGALFIALFVLALRRKFKKGGE